MYKQLRRAAFHVLQPLPIGSRRAVDRWLRASRELARLERADAVVVSYPKSGRTWLRAFLAAYFQQALGLATDALFGFDNYHALDRRVPRILFTHDAYFDARLDDHRLALRLRPRRPVFLARDPRDTVVSSYFQNRFRMAPEKRVIYALDRPEVAEIDGFVMDAELGLPHVLAFYERWARRLPLLPEMPILRYEDLKAEPASGFARLLEAVGVTPEPAALVEAIAATSFERMREKERAGAFAGEGGRFGAGESGRPEAHAQGIRLPPGRAAAVGPLSRAAPWPAGCGGIADWSKAASRSR